MLRSELTEAELRRAVSALYYAVFHQLVTAAADQLAAGNPALSERLGRTFAHRTMKEVCELVLHPSREVRVRRLGVALADPGAELQMVARVFLSLQEAREAADYDLSQTIQRQTALDHLREVHIAFDAIPAVQAAASGRHFLAALAFVDRWTRRA